MAESAASLETPDTGEDKKDVLDAAVKDEAQEMIKTEDESNQETDAEATEELEEAMDVSLNISLEIDEDVREKLGVYTCTRASRSFKCLRKMITSMLSLLQRKF